MNRPYNAYMSSSRPVNMKNIEDRALRITWDDGRVDELTWLYLRGVCPCASCVDEGTGRRTLDVTRLAADIRPISMAFVGQYAVRFQWSDSHNTGLYTFEALRRWGDAAASEQNSTKNENVGNSSGDSSV